MTRQDRALNAVFGQIELLESLAIAGGDEVLAGELRNSMMAALERYCDRQREKLEIELLVPGPQTAA
ncbi:hypothetical protein [Asticcacaulis sp. W401b]|uniref:hypothetical protein n=1 Tax=Asticcacaulis sp. W401b TaxID=3388666 RepID=UPI00397091B5